MTLQTFAKRNNINYNDIYRFILSQKYFSYSNGLFDLNINDADEMAILVSYRAYSYEKRNGNNEADLEEIIRKKAEEVKQEQAAIEEERSRRIKIEESERADEEIRKRQAMAQMLISSGFNFEGYRIVKYSGYISGDDAIEVKRGLDGIILHATNVGDALMRSLTQIRRNALQELKEAAYDLGCNAVIGVDFDYITLEPETTDIVGNTSYLPYVFGVTANGNAVIIEKIKDDE